MTHPFTTDEITVSRLQIGLTINLTDNLFQRQGIQHTKKNIICLQQGKENSLKPSHSKTPNQE